MGAERDRVAGFGRLEDGLLASGDRSVIIDHPFAGTLELLAEAGPDGTGPQPLFCENETNLARLYGAEPVTPSPKDGINDHMIHGAATVNPVATGTMLWSKQLFYCDVARWLDGDPTQPTPPAVRKSGRNSTWRNYDGFDIVSMADKWEYPWFAAWDLDNLIVSEYFHGDNGAAIGAFHQTGWTGLIADVILRRHGAVRPLGEVLRDTARKAQP